jgi:hypothetical protein
MGTIINIDVYQTVLTVMYISVEWLNSGLGPVVESRMAAPDN